MILTAPIDIQNNITITNGGTLYMADGGSIGGNLSVGNATIEGGILAVDGTTTVANNNTLNIYGTLDSGTIVNNGTINGDGALQWNSLTNNGNISGPGGSYSSGSVPAFNPYDLNTGGAVLPIKLLSFSATAALAVVTLEWTTVEEENNDFFTIERSADGINYLPLLTLPGAGNSADPLSYKVSDNSPLPGINYYRLKQTDYDGKFEYFGPVSAAFSAVSLRAYPNPASDKIYLETGQKISQIDIFSASGTLVRTIRSLPDYEPSIDVADLLQGAYIMNVYTAAQRSTVRFVKVNE